MIVVGIDGSEHAAKALDWALQEAKLRDTGVRAVWAWTLPAATGRMGFYAEPLRDPALYRDGAEKSLEAFMVDAGPAPEGVALDYGVEQGPPADVLVRAADGADLLVVGSRGLGGFASMLLGSVSQQCVQHASCPVVVVR